MKFRKFFKQHFKETLPMSIYGLWGDNFVCTFRGEVVWTPNLKFYNRTSVDTLPSSLIFLGTVTFGAFGHPHDTNTDIISNKWSLIDAAWGILPHFYFLLHQNHIKSNIAQSFVANMLSGDYNVYTGRHFSLDIIKVICNDRTTLGTGNVENQPQHLSMLGQAFNLL